MRTAVVVAGGRGVRLARQGGKQLMPLAGRPMLSWTLRAFESASTIDSVVVAFGPEGVESLPALVEGWGLSKVHGIVPAGAERQDSVAAGLAAAPTGTDVVVVHDGARPLVLPADIDACVEALPGFDGVVLGRPAVDTIKEAAADGVVTRTPDRSGLWYAETPQVFPLDTLLEAQAAARRDGFVGTDDAVLVERVGGRVCMLSAQGANLKITVPADVSFAESVLLGREERT